MRLRKDDIVTVISGKDKGKKGKVLKTFPREGAAIVEGVRYASHFIRPSQDNPKGGITKFEGKINISKIQLVCPKCSKPVRIGYQLLADGTRQRACKKCQEII